MTAPDSVERIHAFLESSGWTRDPVSVSFLAAGEYNANYLIETREGPRVLRINQGSQLGLGQDQIAYEYEVLKALADSGVTPKPFACHTDPEDLGGGALLMEFLPGTALDYTRDLDRAAHIFARVHTQPVPDGAFIVQADPVMDIARESLGLVRRFAQHPLTRERDQIMSYYYEVLELGEETRHLFEGEDLCLVNTEVNSGNFLVGDKRAYLVDWEKAVVSYRYQDLGHFMVPTTTLWKTDVCLGAGEKEAFLRAYHAHACPDMDLDEMKEKTRVMERTILLRALAWCFMAWYEYTQTDRPLQNSETFSKIQKYLSDIPWILNSVA